MSRIRKAKVTEADIARVAKVLRAHGVGIAVVDMQPGGALRIITTEGQALTANEEEEQLTRELAEHRAKNGYGGPQGTA